MHFIKKEPVCDARNKMDGTDKSTCLYPHGVLEPVDLEGVTLYNSPIILFYCWWTSNWHFGLLLQQQ